MCHLTLLIRVPRRSWVKHGTYEISNVPARVQKRLKSRPLRLDVFYYTLMLLYSSSDTIRHSL